MKQTIDAIYENGIFKPVHPVPIPIADGRLVTLVLDDSLLPEPLRLAAQVYEGLLPEEVDEIEQITLDRSHFLDR